MNVQQPTTKHFLPAPLTVWVARSVHGLLLLIVAVGLPILCILHCEILDRQHYTAELASPSIAHQHTHGHDHRQPLAAADHAAHPVLADDTPRADTIVLVGAVCHPHHHTAPPAVYPAVLHDVAYAAVAPVPLRLPPRSMPAWTSLAPRSPDPPPRTIA